MPIEQAEAQALCTTTRQHPLCVQYRPPQQRCVQCVKWVSVVYLHTHTHTHVSESPNSMFKMVARNQQVKQIAQIDVDYNFSAQQCRRECHILPFCEAYSHDAVSEFMNFVIYYYYFNYRQ
jgi:hypothetical protein